MTKEQVENQLEKKERTCNRLFKAGLVGITLSTIIIINSLSHIYKANTLSKLATIQENKKLFEKERNMFRNVYVVGATGIISSALLTFGAYGFSPKYYRV